MNTTRIEELAKEFNNMSLRISVLTKALTELIEEHKSTTVNDDLVSIKMAANLIGVGRNTLFAWLKKDRYLFTKAHSRNLPYERWIRDGWFEVVATKSNPGLNNPTTIFTTYLTQKGLKKIIEIYGGEVKQLNNETDAALAAQTMELNNQTLTNRKELTEIQKLVLDEIFNNEQIMEGFKKNDTPFPTSDLKLINEKLKARWLK